MSPTKKKRSIVPIRHTFEDGSSIQICDCIGVPLVAPEHGFLPDKYCRHCGKKLLWEQRSDHEKLMKERDERLYGIKNE